MSFYYEDILRMDWGLGNPNRTAALIAMLMVASWLFAQLHRNGFWLSLIVFTALGACLLQTFSRGGLLAALIGNGLLLFWTAKPWRPKRTLAVVLAVCALVGGSFLLTASERYASSWQGDPSVLNRIELWKHVPRMIVDAPQGWGLGRSQTAYMEWYQSPERTERFLNLANLHLTILAEVSWPLRFAYFFSWLLAFLTAWPSANPIKLAIPFGILSAFFVAGIFTHFGGAWPVYLVAATAFAFAVFVRIRTKGLPSPAALAAACLLAVAFCGMIGLAGSSSGGIPIQRIGPAVLIGTAPATCWVLLSPETLGNNPGKTWRKFLQNNPAPAIAFVSDPEHIPPDPPAIAIGAATPEALSVLAAKSPKRIILLNSPLFPAEFHILFPHAAATAVFGEFARTPSLSAWRGNSFVIPGAGDYLPNWPDALAQTLTQQ